jgi:HlyD family secretion protein
MSVQPVRAERRALQSHTRLALLLVLVPLIGLGVWGATASISGAVVAPARVAVESDIKKVQHRDGGIVTELLVSEGDHVRGGQVLARLDSTVIKANLASVIDQQMQFTARRMRLEAERDGRDQLAAPPTDLPFSQIAPMLAAERRLLEERRASREQKKAELRQQIDQSQREIDGLQAQAEAQASQYKLIEGELVGLRKLYEQDYVPITRVDDLEREAARLEGERGELDSSVARARARIDEVRIDILQTDSDALTEVMSDLKDAQIKLAELAQQRAVLEDQLNRSEVRAPLSGYVHQLAIHTVGGVVGPGETMMYIVPEQDSLIVAARIDPQHVDQVRPGSLAHVRFTAFSARVTPEVTARVERLAADATVDDRTGKSYYLAELKLDAASLPPEMRGRLLAGMPAEVHIATSRRNVLSYFLKPLTDQMSRSFKEE